MNLEECKINDTLLHYYNEQVKEENTHKTIDGCHFIDSIWGPGKIDLSGPYGKYEFLFVVHNVNFYGPPEQKEKLLAVLIEKEIIVPVVEK